MLPDRIRHDDSILAGKFENYCVQYDPTERQDRHHVGNPTIIEVVQTLVQWLRPTTSVVLIQRDQNRHFDEIQYPEAFGAGEEDIGNYEAVQDPEREMMLAKCLAHYLLDHVVDVANDFPNGFYLVPSQLPVFDCGGAGRRRRLRCVDRLIHHHAFVGSVKEREVGSLVCSIFAAATAVAAACERVDSFDGHGP